MRLSGLLSSLFLSSSSVQCILYPAYLLVPTVIYFLPLSYSRHRCMTQMCFRFNQCFPIQINHNNSYFCVGLNMVSPLGVPSDPSMPCSQSAVTPKMLGSAHCCLLSFTPSLSLPYAPFSFLSTHPFCQRLIGLEMIRFILDVNAVIMLLLEKKRKKNHPPHALKPNLK